MIRFFYGWKRKLGLVTIVLGWLFIALWIRSGFVVDYALGQYFRFTSLSAVSTASALHDKLPFGKIELASGIRPCQEDH